MNHSVSVTIVRGFTLLLLFAAGSKKRSTIKKVFTAEESGGTTQKRSTKGYDNSQNNCCDVDICEISLLRQAFLRRYRQERNGQLHVDLNMKHSI